MNDNSMEGIFGIAILGAVLVIVGLITSRKLPKTQKNNRVRKFGAVALALIFFGFMTFAPFVPSYSNARSLDELKVENINSIEDVAEFNKKLENLPKILKICEPTFIW